MSSPPLSPYSDAGSISDGYQSSFGDYNSGIDDSPSEDFNEDKYEFEVLDTKKVAIQMKDTIRRIIGILNVNKTEARHLLNNNRWDYDKLIENFLHSTSEDDFRLKFGLPLRKQLSPKALQLECDICLTAATCDSNSTLVGVNECNHKYCLDCWNNYLTARLLEVSAGNTVSCPAHKCVALVEDTMVMRLLQDENCKKKFELAILNMYVQNNPALRWCPAVGCIYAICVTYVQQRTVECKCNHVFCFGCGDTAHEPINCDMAEKWSKVVSLNVATHDWLAKNTKKCTQCGVHIQKNGGCNYIYCTSCKSAFCWLCGISMNREEHTAPHKCNLFVIPTNAAGSSNATKSASARREHYATRYFNHLLSSKFELNLYEMVENKITMLETEQNIARTNVQFFHHAIRVLMASRRILSATYAFAYYTAECNQLHIFLDNQRDLEVATEKLSDMLENEEITSENLERVQEVLETKFSYCKSRQQTLLKHVSEGYALGWWTTNLSSH